MLALLAVFGPLAVFAQDPTLVAPTDPLTPEEQRALFHLPPGFEIQLVACEPDIGQPMNLQFDAAGRLWVTSSVEYPYPADDPGVEPRDERFAGSDEPHPPRDRVMVFSGIGPDGTPGSATKFTEGLNIPIGHLPLADGALVYGIPSLKRYTDANGDGVADSHETLLTGFGNVDTHGMVNGLRRWIDGWVYACHGFRNDSKVLGADGRTIAMNSGNTFRFRPDGTGLEQFTWGEVNPFGMTFDPLGNLYNADCHSRPLTLLIRGARYQSFGKPHDGLGFGPEMIDHSHGSTGICGPAYYAATHFPADYRDNLFLCNPVTGRVHRDKLVWTGSSPKVDTQPDFVTCDDPWFRPVDLAVGPDGALYVADFYNAIIGHYEVPLAHPKRDREKGRVWRVVYVGEQGERRDSLPTPPDLTSKSAEELAALLGDENLTVRVAATHELVDRQGAEAVKVVKALFDDEASGGRQPSEHVTENLREQSRGADAPRSPGTRRAHGMWILERLDALDDDLVAELSHDESRLVRTHVAKLLAERSEWSSGEREMALRLLGDDDAFVRRAAADALGRHPDLASVRPLLDTLAATAEEDTHLVYAIRIALREVLTASEEVATIPLDSYSPADLRAIAGVAPAVKTAAGANLLAAILKADLLTSIDPVSDAAWPTAFGHVFRHGDESGLDDLISTVRTHRTDDAEGQFALLEAASKALEQRGADPSVLLGDWGRDLATAAFESAAGTLAWSQASSGGDTPTWVEQERPCADGRKSLFWCSHPNGEQRTGALRSQPFELPESLSFFIAGHRGFPDKPPHERNAVRLRDAATGAVLREAFPPRNDNARQIAWDLKDVAGRQGFVELEDGDTDRAYAWLAAGRFSVEGLNPGGSGPGRAAELIAMLNLEDFAPRLKSLLGDPQAGEPVRAAAAEALIGLDGDPLLAALVPLIGDPAVPTLLKEKVVAAALEDHPGQAADAVAAAVKTLPSSAQQPLAERLAGTAVGARTLLDLVEKGLASPRLLTRPGVAFRLAVQSGTDFAERVETLTADLPAEDETVRQLIETRTRAFDPAAASVERGVEIFTKNCANCHRIGAEGSLVGPQLDGIGVRGFTRIAEDLLDPNRNVDGAFRSSTLVLTDGRVLTGLFRREEGESLVFADNAGKEFSVAKDEIDERVASPLSLMPSNFGEALPEEQFRDLMAYLLAQRQAGPSEGASEGLE